MIPTISQAFLSGRHLSALDQATVLHVAVDLHDSDCLLAAATKLSGCHIAIADVASDAPAARLLAEAARGLGARVSHIGALEVDDRRNAEGLARTLAALYDAVDCAQLTAAEALTLERLAGIPVFIGLGSANHPSRALLPPLQSLVGPTHVSTGEQQRRLVQSVLLACLP